MTPFNWIDHYPGRVTVCDRQGRIIAMNSGSAQAYARFGGRDLIGQSLFDCHSEASIALLQEQLTRQTARTYITEKGDSRYLVQQSPWYADAQFGGLVETVLELPGDLPVIQR